MNRTELMRELRKMRFEGAYKGWTEKRLSQREAVEILGVCDRTFRRYVQRFEGDGVEGLIDYRLGQVSRKRPAAPPVVFREARALLLLFRRGTRWRRGMGRNSGESILKLGVEVI